MAPVRFAVDPVLNTVFLHHSTEPRQTPNTPNEFVFCGINEAKIKKIQVKKTAKYTKQTPIVSSQSTKDIAVLNEKVRVGDTGSNDHNEETSEGELKFPPPPPNPPKVCEQREVNLLYALCSHLLPFYGESRLYHPPFS